MVAINYFRDERNTVEKYVEETGIDVPILLNGHELRKEYNVRSAPTSFWVDRKGRIVSYELGFSGDLEETVSTMLAVPKTD